MATDAHAAADFYRTARGIVAARLLRRRLAALWPALGTQSLLGIGYVPPYLELWRHAAGDGPAPRLIALSPPLAGPVRWPRVGGGLALTAEEDALPFADLSFDRILLVHGLEGAENARRLLREVWRVLKDDGRLLVVAPNRRGLWAHVETTPFGHGQPYSPGQVGRLLAASMFRVEKRDAALWLPPLNLRLALRSAQVVERIGRRVAPQFAGLVIAEAVKEVYAAIPAKAVPARRRAMVTEAA